MRATKVSIWRADNEPTYELNHGSYKLHKGEACLKLKLHKAEAAGLPTDDLDYWSVVCTTKNGDVISSFVTKTEKKNGWLHLKLKV